MQTRDDEGQVARIGKEDKVEEHLKENLYSFSMGAVTSAGGLKQHRFALISLA